jgi:50S ribosomal subunit-associated GTPase HflX
VATIPALFVFNKTDRADPDVTRALLARHGGVAVSALDPTSLDPLIQEFDRRFGPAEVGPPTDPALAGAS